MVRNTSTIVFFALFMISCGNQEDQTSNSSRLDPAMDAFDAPAESLDQPEKEIQYASDPNANFVVISNDQKENGNREVVTKRIGPSGTSFARREISCEEFTFRYLGEGDTLEQALQDSANIGKMAALTGTSASSDVANEACK